MNQLKIRIHISCYSEERDENVSFMKTFDNLEESIKWLKEKGE